MQLVDIFGQEIQIVIRLHVVFKGEVIFALVIVAEAHVVIIVVSMHRALPLVYFSFNILVFKVPLIEDVTHIFMRCFVLFILLDSFEVPFNGLIVVFHELVVDPDVVVARSILWSYL